ncbi:MAG: hypothetical protein ABIO83_04415 [Ilumatobacteraceae bacterium]
MAVTNEFNAQIIDEFRRNGGKAGQFGDSPLLIHHTVGAKSGTIWATLLVPLIDGDERYVFASAARRDREPGLVRQPQGQT